jgi:NAD(P)-dependent dehydrogenase (short-subunit alcohol dehydrogenase family)
MKTFKDKVAVVTGAASGIGKGMAQTFVEAGMKVVLADIDEERLKKTTASLKDAGGDVIGILTDVSKPEQIQNLLEKTIKTYGAVHVLCNNAGVSYTGPSSWETALEGWRWVLDVNLIGVVNGIHTFMPIMLKQECEGHIVNTASGAGIVSNPFNAPYGVSKHGVVALSETLHDEMLTRGAKIKVSVLCPGPINTDIFNSVKRNRPEYVPLPPELSPEEDIFMKAYEIWLQRGTDPKEVGRMVLEAIREERLYVFTHDLSMFTEERLKNIINLKNPEPLSVLQEVASIVEELMAHKVGP